MRPILFVVLFLLAVGILYKANESYMAPEINERNLVIPDGFVPDMQGRGLRVALVGDLHVNEFASAYDDLSDLLKRILASKPQLILLLGDYTEKPDSVSNMDTHRDEVAQRLSLLTSVPVAAVLGNYETWSGLAEWKQSLSEAGITVLHNEVETINLKGNGLCVRGLGDAYTKQFKRVDFPGECTDLPKITITHDPAGAFKAGIEGIIFAAHTHCGQIRLPLLGALWIPTEAPREATCGLYQDANRLLWVTSGVGTSILPLRLGAQSQWDLLTLREE